MDKYYLILARTKQRTWQDRHKVRGSPSGSRRIPRGRQVSQDHTTRRGGPQADSGLDQTLLPVAEDA